jgi:hypothetical protein
MNTTYLTEREVAKIIRMALSTLRNDRCLRRGLPYTKLGRSVRYSLDDVVSYMEARKIRFE